MFRWIYLSIKHMTIIPLKQHNLYISFPFTKFSPFTDGFKDCWGWDPDWAGVSGPLRAGHQHQPRRDRVEWDQRRWVGLGQPESGSQAGFILSYKTMAEVNSVGEWVNILKISQLFTKCRARNFKQIVTVPADAGYSLSHLIVCRHNNNNNNNNNNNLWGCCRWTSRGGAGATWGPW